MVTTSTKPSARLTNGIAFAHADFVLTGIVMTMLGPLLPILSARWSLNDTQAGNLFLTQYIASTGGMLSSGVLVRRFGYRFTLLWGAALMVAGVGLLGSSGRFMGLVAIAIIGLGFGTTTPTANLFVSDSSPDNRASALNLLNSSWGIGAMSPPLIIAALQRVHRLPIFFYGLAGGLAVLVIALMTVRFFADETSQIQSAESINAGGWNASFLVVLGTMFFIYVGTETAVGGWVASYAQRLAPGSPSMWSMMPAFFYGTLLLGRASAPLMLRSVQELRVAAAGTAVAVVGILVLLAGRSLFSVMAGASLAGLGLSTIYPIQVSLLPRWLGPMVTTVAGFMFALGNFGGGVIPWSVGALSTRFSNLRAGFLVPLAGALILTIFYSRQLRSFSSLRKIISA